MSDEIESFDGILDGDYFVDEQVKEEEAARQRRLKRKRRLEKIQQSTGNERSTPQDSFEVSDQADEIHNNGAGFSSFSSPSQGEIGALKNQNPDTGIGKRDGDTGEFDMFSSSVSPPSGVPSELRNEDNNNLHGKVDNQQDWDDAEGYYKATLGETICLSLSNDNTVTFRVSGVVGKGVFSTVLKVFVTDCTSNLLPKECAAKFIRHNETMANAAAKEVKALQRLRRSLGVISLLLPSDSSPLEYRGHTILVFPHMECNLRDLLKKYGQGLGLSLTAVTSYFRQLLAALTELQKHKIIHSDLKPDNILVSADFSSVSICDFGSAIDSQESVDMITPYLVSRFYRAPEIILGLIPTFAIDLWSISVTMAELFLGKVVFNGSDNNDMLKVIMEVLGPFSNRLIRQHLVQTKKFPLKAHFCQEGTTFVFRQATVDPVTEHPVHKAVSLHSFVPCFQSQILKAKSAADSRTSVLRFADVLQKCMALDPTRRISVQDAIRHDVFKKPKK